MSKYAIIGFGCAGFHCATAIRERDPDGEIHIYSDTDLPPYNPMLTTYYVADRLEYSGMFPFGGLEQIAEDYRLVMMGQGALKVDVAQKQVTARDGTTMRYDRLLISTGAASLIPPIPGLSPSRLFSMRTVEDALCLKKSLEEDAPRRALVVGASMVGIKLVELFHNRGIHTTLVDLAPRIFPTVSYPAAAQVIQRRLEAQGIGFKLGCSVTGAWETDTGCIFTLSDNSKLETDLIAVCIGTRANVGLVAGQLEIGKGIAVNRMMETSAPGVYAAGDCCEGLNLQTGERQLIGLWANAGYQGRCAGANMAGESQELAGNINHNITHFMDMDFIGYGDNRAEGETLTFGSPDSGLYLHVVCRDKRIQGANILDNYHISGVLKNYILRLFQGDMGRISPWQKGLLYREGLHPEFIERLEAALQ